MKTRMILIAALILVLLLAPFQAVQAAASAESAPIPVKILFTHDLHSYFLPHPVLSDEGLPDMLGGYARLAAAINEQKQQNPQGTLVLDAGDFSMGTLFQTQFRNQAMELCLMGQMGYDFTTLGNHEFDADSRGLAEMLNSARQWKGLLPQILCSNISFKAGQENASGLKPAMADFPVQDYKVIEKQGLKIGLFGLFGKEAAEVTVLGKDVDFKDPATEAGRVVSILKNQEKADLIVCLSHCGTSSDPGKSEDELLAQAVPDIDVIISGHSHTVLEKPITVGDTLIVSAGSYGRYLGVLDLNCIPGQGVTAADYELIEMNPEISGDPAIAQVIETYKGIVNQNYLSDFGLTFDQKIAESDFNLESLASAYDNPRETGLGDLVADSYRYAVEKAEGPDYQYVNAAVQAQGEIRESIVAGDLNTDDVFRILSLGLGPDGSVGYPLVGIYLNGAEIKNCLEIQSTVAPLKANDDYRLQVSGVFFKYNPNRLPFNRVYDVLISTPAGGYEAIQDDQLYRLVISYYSGSILGKMGGQTYGLVNVTPRNSQGEPLSNLDDAIIDADYSKPGIQELKQWPALAAYLQSMPDTDGDGIPNLMSRYQQPAGRYVSVASWNIADLVKEPNRITLGLMVIIAVLIAAPIGTVRLVRRRRRNR